MFAGLISLLYYLTVYPVKVLFTLPWYMPTLAIPLYWVGLISVGSYLLILALQNFVFENKPVDMKKKYNAEWALVTGASSGIGLAMTEKLAKQGINVVMVAIDDDLLKTSHANMQKSFPALKFRKVGVDLSSPTFMDAVKSATDDLNINLLFNNAGFITTGFFHTTSLKRSMANFECNAGCVLPLTHHFVNKMVERKEKGFVGFTSSSAGFVPSPLSALYPSTKSFLTFFATSLAAEVRSLGIDVVVVHPSPMATNFFKNSGGMQALDAFKQFAVGPGVIADVMFNSAGRFVIRDQGVITVVLRILTKILDPVLFAELVCRTAHLSGDYKHFQQKKD
jgi:short-subunit dehydrogenase